MKIEIHDVDHGGSAVVTGPAGHRLMRDCGFCSDRKWYPSVMYHGQRIDTLMLMNLDEDHCEDLPYLRQNCGIGAVVSKARKRGIKEEGLHDFVGSERTSSVHPGPPGASCSCAPQGRSQS